jgi:hypothetical protein
MAKVSIIGPSERHLWCDEGGKWNSDNWKN